MREATIDAKIAQRGAATVRSVTAQLRVLSLPETTPGMHALARHRAHQGACDLAETIRQLGSLSTNSTHTDVRRAAAECAATLAQFLDASVPGTLIAGA